jgi:glycosyltransferase involved in cell wall biosynthesis
MTLHPSTHRAHPDAVKAPAPVTVLLATRNGAAHLAEQLDSLLAQTLPARILVRDDASGDATPALIDHYARKHPSIEHIEPGSPASGSATANFSRLLSHVLGTSSAPPYLMLCDQDDVWLPAKVEVTLARMRTLERSYPGQPLLVHTDMIVTDEDLRPLHPSLWGYQHSNPHLDGLNRLLLQNTVTGCSVLCNLALARLAAPIPAAVAMHDWWLALTASAFGHIGIVEEPTLYYRQHERNATGAKRFDLPFVLGRLRSRALLDKNFTQAEAFLDRYAARCSPVQRRLLEDFIALRDAPWLRRRRILVARRLFKQGWIRNLGLLANV